MTAVERAAMKPYEPLIAFAHEFPGLAVIVACHDRKMDADGRQAADVDRGRERLIGRPVGPW
jgi:hypothetical protein